MHFQGRATNLKMDQFFDFIFWVVWLEVFFKGLIFRCLLWYYWFLILIACYDILREIAGMILSKIKKSANGIQGKKLNTVEWVL